jgi:hypothetical protein
MFTTLHLEDKAHIAITNLANPLVNLPRDTTEVIATSPAGIVPCYQETSVATVTYPDGSTTTGKLVKDTNTSVILDSTNERTVCYHPHTLRIPLRTTWRLESNENVIVHASLPHLTWTPFYTMTIDATTQKIVQLALCARINNGGGALTVDSIVFKTNDRSRRDDDCIQLQSAVLESVPASYIPQSRRVKMSEQITVAKAGNGLTTFTLSTDETKGFTLPVIANELVIPLWTNNSVSDQVVYRYYNGDNHVSYGYDLLMGNTFTPSGQITTITTDNVIVRQTFFNNTGRDVIEVNLGASDLFKVDQNLTPSTFMSRDKLVTTITSKVSAKVAIKGLPGHSVQVRTLNVGANVI